MQREASSSESFLNDVRLGWVEHLQKEVLHA